MRNIGMIFGAQYYRPPFPTRECWERDFENMRKLGFNTVKLWAVWNAIEYERGVFDFNDLDDLMNLAGRVGLQVVLNTIPEGAPYWTREGNQDAYYRTAGGQAVTYGGPANLPTAGWPGLCMDKEEAAAMATEFIAKVAERYRAHPALFAIDVWNEPHLEPMFDYRTDMLCYCGHSVARFRQWLKDKYGTLEALNRTWFRTYTVWEQVDAPPRPGTWTDMMDWRKFWLDNMRRWMRLRVEAVRRVAPEVPVQSHVAYSGYVGTRGGGGLANELGDEFLLSRETDIFGLTCFPKWLMRDDPFFNHLINNEIVAAACFNRPFYQVELQGGGGKAGLLCGEVPTGRDIRLWNYATIAAGGKGVTYWQYAPEPAGIESPGFGLTGFLGENTERSLEAGHCARELTHDTLARAVRVPAMNAIYLSRDNSVWFYGADRQEELYAQAVHGMYRAALGAGVPVTFAHQDRVETLYEDGVRTLLLPMPIVLSQRETDALCAFVERGGTVVAEACPGLYDETGKLDERTRALRQLFGLAHVELQGLKEGARVSAEGGEGVAFVGSLYRQVVAPEENVLLKAVFADGYPALTERRLGKGKAVWLGSFVAMLNAKTRQRATEETLLQYLHRGGYPQFQSIKVSASDNAGPGLAPVVRLLETEDQYILVGMNFCETRAGVAVTLRDSWQGEGVLSFEMGPGEAFWKAYGK